MSQEISWVAAIHSAAFRDAHSGIVTHSMIEGATPEIIQLYWERALRGGKVGLVAATGNQVVGAVLFGADRFSSIGEGLGEMYALYVSPRHQRHGIGNRLWEASCRRLKADGFHYMRVRVVKGNPAIAFYMAMGASTTEHVDLKSLSDEIPVVTLEKRL